MVHVLILIVWYSSGCVTAADGSVRGTRVFNWCIAVMNVQVACTPPFRVLDGRI